MAVMKSYPFKLIGLILISLLMVPTVNLLTAAPEQKFEWNNRSLFYNVDFLKRAAARVLTPLGISVSPQKVVIGKDQWLFLGDSFEETITDGRRPATIDDRKFGERVKSAMGAWRSYLKDHGVGLFKIIVGPDKETIYPEHLPDWMHASAPTAFDVFMQESGNDYVDVRPALLEAKQNDVAPLYYRTDTHWNSLGAAVAFRHFAERMSAEAPGIRWPDEDLYRLSSSSTRGGGDLVTCH